MKNLLKKVAGWSGEREYMEWKKKGYQGKWIRNLKTVTHWEVIGKYVDRCSE